MNSARRQFLSFVVVALLSIAGASGGEYFLDPIAGDNTNPGTRSAPWGSLASVAALPRTFETGDVLVLLAGHHGEVVLRQRNAGPVVIRPDRGARVLLSRLQLVDAAFWTVEGVEITPDPRAPTTPRALVTVSGEDNVIRSCVVYTVRDSSRWTAEDWDRRAFHGLEVGGQRQLVQGNRIANINFGLYVPADATAITVRGNVIENFCGDGIRGIGSDCVYEGNIVKNLYKVNANHPDAFQSWSVGEGKVGQGVVRRVVLRGNYFLSYDDPARPLRGSMHGIGCFDGFFEDWVVENNVILTNAWHGIAFYGARRCRVVNNTVADLDPSDRELPWIKITAHKNGALSADNLVRNNLTSKLAIDAGTAVVDHNLSVPDSRSFFLHWAARDLSVTVGLGAVQQGSSDQAATVDFTGQSRRSGATSHLSIGAYQLSEDSAGDARFRNEPHLAVPSLPSD